MKTATRAVKGILLLGVVVGVLTQAGSARSADLWTVSSNPVWSPDGTSVAWAEVSPAGTRYRIETAAAASLSTPHTIFSSKPFPGGCCGPLRWTSSGRILFIANFTLFSIPVTGGTPTVLFSRSTSDYVLSANQETAAVVDGCDCGHATDKIALVNVSGGTTRELSGPKNVSYDPVSFSPDGTQLVFTTARHNPTTDGWSDFHFMAVQVRGGTPVPLAASGLVGARFVTAHMSSPVWSPDGNWISAWLLTSTTVRLITIDTHTGRATSAAPPRTQGSSPLAWSPDSSRLAYEATLRLGNNAQFAVATVDPNGTARTVFWSGSSKFYEASAFAWSPDSSKLLFFVRLGESGPVQLITAAADGSGFMRIH